MGQPLTGVTVESGDEFHGDAQCSDFQNSTYQTLGPGDEWSVSIACHIRPGHQRNHPENTYSEPELATIEDVISYVVALLQNVTRYVGNRLTFDVQIGPTEEPDE